MTAATSAGTELPYRGLRVLDLAGRTAPHCGQLLALFGADVVLVEPPTASGARDDLAWLAFNAGKSSLVCDPSQPAGRAQLEALARRADVVIEGDAPLADFRPRKSNPSLVHVTVTPFGGTGPRAHWRSSELVAQAAGGILSLSGDRDFPPAQIGIPLALGMAGAQAACGVLLALARRARTGEGATIDASRQEAVANLLFTTQFMAHVLNQPGQRGEAPLTASGKKLTRRVLWPCKDGYVTWTLWTGPGMGPKNEQTFAWMREAGVPEAEELLAVPWPEMSTADLTPELLLRTNEAVGRFFGSLTTEEINREALARRILLYAIASPSDVAANEQLHARDAFRPLALPDGRRVSIVGTPVRSSAYPVEIGRSVPALGAGGARSAEAWTAERPPRTSQPSAPGALPLAGVRVLDLGWAVVSPLVTKYLALFGADVAKLELRKRPDPVRMTGPYPLGKPGIDGSASFVSINASKRSVGIDLARPDAHALVMKLAAKADVVCENFAPGIAPKLGYDYAAFRAARPDLVMLALSMQGQTGPRAAQPGLGNHLQAMSGIDFLTGFPEGPPGGPNQVMPDFIGPWIALASVLAALEHRRKTGEGQYIDVSQLEAILLYAQPALIEYALTGVVPSRMGNRSRTMSPHGVYPVKGRDRWIAIAVQGDAEWGRLRALLPPPTRERFPAQLSTAARLEAGAALDEAIAGWTREQDAEALTTALQTQGIAAYPVCDGRDVLEDPQLAFRAHLRHVDHPKLGDQIVDCPSFRIEGLEPRIEPGPMYAAHTAPVIEEWLGLEADEVADLVASGALDFA